MNITRIASLTAILAATIAEGTVRLSFTENYTPPLADTKAHPDLFIHLDASNLGTMSYDVDANGNLRLSSIADPRDNGFYASNWISQAASNRATIRPCALNGRSVLDFGEYRNAASAADLRWSFGGSITNCSNAERDAFIVYANRDDSHYADPFTDYNYTSHTWHSGEEYTLFCTNANSTAHLNLTSAQNIFIDGVKTGNLVSYPNGYHLLWVHNAGGNTLSLNGVGARKNEPQGGMLIAEIYVFCQNIWGTSHPNTITNHLMKKWGIGDVEPYAPPSLSGLTAAMDANGKLDSLALAGGVLAPGNGGAATISLPSGFVPRTGDYPLLTGATLAEGAEAALASWSVSFTPAVEAKAMLAVEDDDVVLRVLPSHTVIYMR